jgi:hypothetical protein
LRYKHLTLVLCTFTVNVVKPLCLDYAINKSTSKSGTVYVLGIFIGGATNLNSQDLLGLCVAIRLAILGDVVLVSLGCLVGCSGS